MRSVLESFTFLVVVSSFVACGPTDLSGGCEAVDLGLSVKWASYNVGAQDIEGLGSYFAWGETKEKEYYDWDNEGDYKWGTGTEPKYHMTKYTGNVEGGDGLITLLSKDDPATVNWGTKWRTPTADEINELLDKKNCKWTWDYQRKGYTVQSLKTGNSIFLPAAQSRVGWLPPIPGSRGEYWSSSVHEVGPSGAYNLGFTPSDFDWYSSDRRWGLSVRAVTEY